MTTTSSTICPMPFSSISYSMTGRMGPCTACDLTKFKSVNDYWHSDELRKLRTDMLNNIRNPVCNECYRREDMGAWNMREYQVGANPNFVYEPDNAVIRQIWFRFSNVCNYMCIDCNGETSTLIAKEEVARGLRPKGETVFVPGNDPKAALEQAKEHVNTLKEINFSGGEPLVQWQHWDMLNYMISEGVRPIVGYFSNLSILDYKGQSITGLWNNFDDVSVHVGFDAMGSGCAYFRRNMSWEGTLENIARIRKESPHVKITLTTTFTWVNAINAVDMLLWFYENLRDLKVTINLVVHKHLDMRVAPKFKKQQIDNALRKLLTIPNPNYDLHMVDSLLNYLWADDLSDAFPDALRWIKGQDDWRKQDFRDAFPEHSDIRYEDYIQNSGEVAEPGLLQQS